MSKQRGTNLLGQNICTVCLNRTRRPDCICARCFEQTPEGKAAKAARAKRANAKKAIKLQFPHCTQCGRKRTRLRGDRPHPGLCSKCYQLTPERNRLIYARRGLTPAPVCVDCGRHMQRQVTRARPEVCSICFRRTPEGRAVQAVREQRARARKRQRKEDREQRYNAIKKITLKPRPQPRERLVPSGADCTHCRLWGGACTIGVPGDRSRGIKAGVRCAAFYNNNEDQ